MKGLGPILMRKLNPQSLIIFFFYKFVKILFINCKTFLSIIKTFFSHKSNNSLGMYVDCSHLKGNDGNL